MVKTAYNWIRYHYLTIQLAEWFLASPFFVKNPFYQMMIKRGARRTRNRPVELLVELTNSCNLACLTCPQSKMKRGRGVMSLDLFRKIIDQAAALHIHSIKLAGLGEPLIDKGIAEKIAYAKKKKLIVKMFTNGMLLNRQKAKQLVESGVDEVFISIDGGSQAVQERLRKGSNFTQIQDNLINFNRLRQEMKTEGEKIPEVVATVTYQDANKSERKLIKESWGNLVDRIRLFPVHNWNVDVNVPRRASEPCHLPFFQMAICWDGRVALCCIDYECHHELGNITRESISSIWQGAASKEVRKAHLERSPESIALCGSCSMLPNWFFSAGL